MRPLIIAALTLCCAVVGCAERKSDEKMLGELAPLIAANEGFEKQANDFVQDPPKKRPEAKKQQILTGKKNIQFRVDRLIEENPRHAELLERTWNEALEKQRAERERWGIEELK